MPLDKSGGKAAFKRNVSTLIGEVGSSPHVQSRAQALAIAYDVKRRGKAAGGAAATPRSLYKKPTHSGPINSVVPGRTDNHAMAVEPGSYVLPADHVSSLGEGNTNAGMTILQHMFSGKEGPYGIGKNPSIKHRAGVPKPPGMKKMRADGGGVEDDSPIDVLTAGGEYVIPRSAVEALGGGDLDHGHRILDQWVVSNRKNHVSTLRKLPGPAKS
jgi:hypothetical protein